MGLAPASSSLTRGCTARDRAGTGKLEARRRAGVGGGRATAVAAPRILGCASAVLSSAACESVSVCQLERGQSVGVSSQERIQQQAAPGRAGRCRRVETSHHRSRLPPQSGPLGREGSKRAAPGTSVAPADPAAHLCHRPQVFLGQHDLAPRLGQRVISVGHGSGSCQRAQPAGRDRHRPYPWHHRPHTGQAGLQAGATAAGAQQAHSRCRRLRAGIAPREAAPGRAQWLQAGLPRRRRMDAPGGPRPCCTGQKAAAKAGCAGCRRSRRHPR